MNFLYINSDTIEKQNINLSSKSWKSDAFVALSDSEVAFLGEGRMQSFVYFSIVFCLLQVVE